MQNSTHGVGYGVDPSRYRSYLLRLFRQETDSPWRCQVNCVVTGEDRQFAGIAELFAFLEAEARQVQDQDCE